MIYTQKKCILLYRIQRHLRITMKNILAVLAVIILTFSFCGTYNISTPVRISKKNKINNDI